MKRISLIIHIAIAAGLLLTGYSYVFSPVKFGIVALAGYAFPLFLLLTVLSLAAAALYCKRHLPVPVAALLLAYHPVTLYMPFHPSQEPSGERISVLSYNTHSWGTSSDSGDALSDKGLAVTQYIAASHADIVCLQESPMACSASHCIDSLIKPVYPYYDTCNDTAGSQITILSRFPIIKKEYINHASSASGSTAYWLNVRGRTIIVINNHLQSTGLSIEQREEFSDIMHGKNKPSRQVSKNIVKQLLAASRLRAPQAEAVAAFIRSHRRGDGGTPVIVCGDFNDIPNSYTHHAIAELLTDCYQASARGPGWSFSRYGMRVRIDNVLCTPDLTPYNFFVDSSVKASDHYPIRGEVGM